MWVLSLLPNWVIHFVTFAGIALVVAAFFIRFIPFVSQYNLPIKLIGALLFIGGVWFEGGLYYLDQTRAEVARIEKESKEATAKIEADYNNKLAKTKQKGEKIVEYVNTYITKESDAKCVIPNNVVSLHNSAVENVVPDATRLTDERASNVTLSTTTKTVVENYNLFHELRQQLISLQDWIREQQKINP
jgi:hypothetical protein